MAKMVIMQGLPASGKSTRAQEILSQGNMVRINKDLIRTMLHFDKFTGQNEGLTREATRTLAKHFLTSGVSVIIDDTNLNEGTLQSWKDLAKECNAKIEYERMGCSYVECVARDSVREKSVGKHVILGMALQNSLYPVPKKGFVLCDLDGTLADIRHRLHFVTHPKDCGLCALLPEGENCCFRKDWKSFFDNIKKDGVREDVVEILKGYASQGFEVLFLSARPDNYRNATEQWLWKAWAFPFAGLLMRHSGDKRPDTEVKKDMFDKFLKGKYPIEAIIDDRPSVIRMWREQGLNVIDVGSGVEF